MVKKSTSIPKKIKSSVNFNGSSKKNISKSPAKSFFSVKNPATMKVIGELPLHDKQTVEDKINIAKKEFSSWSKLSLWERSKYIIEFRKILAQSREEMISTI